MLAAFEWMEDNLNTSKRLIVVGAGAAGFFCAVNAARMNRNLEVIILEKSGKLLSKVKVSGGGRCNVANACFDITAMSRNYPRGNHFVRKAFHQFFTPDTITWFELREVRLKTEDDNRIFPITDSSQTIIECLMREANKYGIKIIMHAEVKEITYEKSKFKLDIRGGSSLEADMVCIAAGGYPKMSMFDWLRKLGHTIIEPVPSLFTFNLPRDPITKLMGVSVKEARVKIRKTALEEKGPLLITHWGLSGPVILRLSAWGAKELKELNYKFTVIVNWLPNMKENELRDHFQSHRVNIPSQPVGSRKSLQGLPARLWEFLVQRSGIGETTRWAEISTREVNRLLGNLVAFEAEINGKTTFKEEFVTAGGIKLSEVDPNTMMSKKIPGLYFAGEILDVDGITGGFNFQHAWTSGFIAASHAAKFNG